MCGRSGSASRATRMPSTAGGLCRGASGASSSSSAINASSISVGWYRSGPPCTTRWPTATKPEGLQRLPGFGELLERLLQGRTVVGDRPVADPLDDPVGHHRTRVRFDDSVFQRRRAGVDDQHRGRGGHHLPCAWIAVIATVLTMSSISAPRDRSLTGFFSPCSTGPIAMAPALRCTAL